MSEKTRRVLTEQQAQALTTPVMDVWHGTGTERDLLDALHRIEDVLTGKVDPPEHAARA